MLVSLLLPLLLQAEPRLSLDYEETDVATALRAIGTYAGVEIDLAPQYAGRRITLKAVNLTVTEVLEALAKQVGGACKPVGKDAFRIAPAWQHAILEKLEKGKAYGLRMEEVELGQALKLFATQCGVRVHCTIDPKRKLELSADDVTWRALLDAIAKAAGGEWALRYGVAYLAPTEELARMPLLPPEIGKDPVVPLHLVDKSIGDALRFLQAVSKRRFEWPDELPDRKVSVRADSVTLAQALALVLYPANLTAAERDGVVVVSTRK